MNLLFITAINIGANTSAGAETINIYINEFSKCGVQVDVIGLSCGRYRNKNIKYHILNIQKKRLLQKLSKAIGWILYPQNKYSYKTSGKMRKKIFNELYNMKIQGYKPDAILLETTSILFLYKKIKKIFPNAIMIGSMHDIAYQGSERKTSLEKNTIKYLIRKRYLKYAKKNEIEAMSEMDLIVPHNKKNIQMLKEEPTLKDKKFFPLVPYYETTYNHNDKTTSKDILFYGLMSRPENYESILWFINNVVIKLPYGFRLIVLGGNPPKKLLDKASEKVLITGFVKNEEVKKYFENSLCLVAPLLFGSGIKTKILSAFSAGLPVLTNDIGIEGIAAENGRNYIHCNMVDDYVQGITNILSDKKRYQNLCKEARKVVNKEYNHHNCALQYLSFIEKLI